jgi:hypothetical protein
VNVFTSALCEKKTRATNQSIHADRGAGKPKKGAETRVSVCHRIVNDGQK